MTGPRLDVDEVLATAKIIVCCGSGGVGKTTTAAALALRAAERGRRTVVLTIDPARRLAQSMGLTELDNTPRAVLGVEEGGSLDAMMLDMKRTFDDIVVEHAEPDKAKAIRTTRSTRPCRPPSPARRSTWRWRSWGSSRPPAPTT